MPCLSKTLNAQTKSTKRVAEHSDCRFQSNDFHELGGESTLVETRTETCQAAHEAQEIGGNNPSAPLKRGLKPVAAWRAHEISEIFG